MRQEEQDLSALWPTHHEVGMQKIGSTIVRIKPNAVSSIVRLPAPHSYQKAEGQTHPVL